MNSVAILADCVAEMRKMPDQAFDLAIVDPPYGIHETSHRKNQRSKVADSKDYPTELWGQDPPGQDYFDELFRVSKYQIIWGGNYFLDYLPSTRCFIVWDKLNGAVDFADCELAWTNFRSSVRKFTFMWNGMMQGDPADGRRQQGNKKLNEVRIHPTQKPVRLYEWCLNMYAEPEYRILDTHLGSGSSRIAAHKHGYDFLGFELVERYYNDQQNRFAEYLKQAENDSRQTNLFK